MKKISIKREQSQAGLSFAEREKFRPQVKNKLLLLLVLLLTAATGAWAQTETLLTTITATGETTYSETTAGVVTVTPSNVGRFSENYGWIWTGSGSVTVEAKEGYTITKCVFKQNDKTPVTISTSPFTITFDNFGDCEQNVYMNGVTSIEVYGPGAPATGYNITLDEGTGNKDSQNWEITPKSSELGGGEAVTVKYNGSREVKSVTVVKKAAVNPNAYLKWDNTKKELVATEIPTEVTTVANADAGVTWSAGTYVVEGQVNISGTITLTGNVDLIIKDGAKLTAKHINGFNGNSSSYNLSIYGQANQTGELVINRTDGNAIMDINKLEVHSAKVTATSSMIYSGGFSYISTFNVYGGLVEAQGTAADGGSGISLKGDGSGSMNIYGGEVKAEGTGNNPDVSYGITSSASSASDAAYVKVYGGKLWAGCANNSALNNRGIYFTKDNGYTSGKIEYSSDNSTWSETKDATTKYVRVGY